MMNDDFVVNFEANPAKAKRSARSKTKPDSEQVKDGAYFTPRALALAICRRLSIKFQPAMIIEPSAGDGAFVAAANTVWSHNHGRQIIAVDVNELFRAKCLAVGATQFLVGDWAIQSQRLELDPSDEPLIIGNPPYKLAQEHIELGLEILPKGGCLAFLLALNFLAGKTRAEEFWPARNLHWLMPIGGPRPAFNMAKRSAALEYGMFIWEKGYSGNALILPPLIWEPDDSDSVSNVIDDGSASELE